LSTAIVLVSGGLDSCVAACIAAQEHALAFLHINYRQRTEGRELRAFHALADHFQVEQRLVADVSFMQQIGGTSLIDPQMPVPDGQAQGFPTTYVPFRNANLLGIGVAWAEVMGALFVYIGAHQQGSLYPDCRREFFEAYNLMIALGTRPGSCIQVQTPLIDLDKAAIVRRGLELEAPFSLTWSCYQSQDLACGRCHSCRRRLQGFRAAGAVDPLPYLQGDSPC
jgi:7-cyano-7-deazaguanine synthase